PSRLFTVSRNSASTCTLLKTSESCQAGKWNYNRVRIAHTRSLLHSKVPIFRDFFCEESSRNGLERTQMGSAISSAFSPLRARTERHLCDASTTRPKQEHLARRLHYGGDHGVIRPVITAKVNVVSRMGRFATRTYCRLGVRYRQGGGAR